MTINDYFILMSIIPAGDAAALERKLKQALGQIQVPTPCLFRRSASLWTAGLCIWPVYSLLTAGLCILC